MDILGALQILSIGSAALALELGLHESDRDVKEDVEVGYGEVELTVLCVEDPFPEVVSLLG